MIVSLFVCLMGDTGFFQQISFDIGARNGSRAVELDSNEFTLKLKKKNTNREELLLRIVCALPKDSKMGLARIICFSKVAPSVWLESPAIEAKY